MTTKKIIKLRCKIKANATNLQYATMRIAHCKFVESTKIDQSLQRLAFLRKAQKLHSVRYAAAKFCKTFSIINRVIQLLPKEAHF